MDQNFWKQLLIDKYKILQYAEEKIPLVNWQALNELMDKPRVNNDMIRAFWNILADDGVVSLDYRDNYGLFSDGMAFRGPRSGNSGAPLFFTNVEDARKYKMAFFLNNCNYYGVIKMHIVG